MKNEFLQEINYITKHMTKSEIHTLNKLILKEIIENKNLFPKKVRKKIIKEGIGLILAKAIPVLGKVGSTVLGYLPTALYAYSMYQSMKPQSEPHPQELTPEQLKQLQQLELLQQQEEMQNQGLLSRIPASVKYGGLGALGAAGLGYYLYRKKKEKEKIKNAAKEAAKQKREYILSQQPIEMDPNKYNIK